MNIKLLDVRFPIKGNDARCCLNTFTDWLDTVVIKVGEGENITQLFIGDVEVGTVITCSHCKANFILEETGHFTWVDPAQYDLVDADVVAIPTA